MGWTSLLVDEDHGGGSVSGRGAVDLAVIAYEFGRHAAPGPLVDCNVVASALSDQEGESQRAVLVEVMAGTAIAASCLGAAPWQNRAEATVRIRWEGGDLLIDGAVRPVESAAQAKHLLVTGMSESGMTQVLMSATAPGVTITALKGLDVTRRFASITFNKVRVPASSLVGEFGRAARRVSHQVQQAAVILSAEAVGAMDAAFGMTVDWAFDRYTFGRALASYQALKHRFADMKSWLEASHAVSDAAAEAVADRTDLAAGRISTPSLSCAASTPRCSPAFRKQQPQRKSRLHGPRYRSRSTVAGSASVTNGTWAGCTIRCNISARIRSTANIITATSCSACTTRFRKTSSCRCRMTKWFTASARSWGECPATTGNALRIYAHITPSCSVIPARS